MYRFVLALVLAMTCGTAVAGEFAKTKAATNGVNMTQERVTVLPQDEYKPYLTIFGNPNDPKVKELEHWFKTDRKLRAIKDQCHYKVIDSTGPLYAARYASGIKKLPCVRLQDVTQNKPVAEFCGREIPITKEALFHGLNSKAATATCWRTWRGDEEPVDGDDNDPPAQPLDEHKQAPKEEFPWAVLVILCGLTSAAALALKLKEFNGGTTTKSYRVK